MTECKVWLDGEYLGYHYGGFCQFDFIIPDLKAGVHKLVLKVDNSFNEDSIPQKGLVYGTENVFVLAVDRDAYDDYEHNRFSIETLNKAETLFKHEVPE